MAKLASLSTAFWLLMLSAPARAEPVYEFVAACKQEALGHCFYRIQDRLTRLNAGAPRRICLPAAFGSTLFESLSVPVSVLDHVRLALSAARFGSAGQDVDEAIARIVGAIYRCH